MPRGGVHVLSAQCPSRSVRGPSTLQGHLQEAPVAWCSLLLFLQWFRPLTGSLGRSEWPLRALPACLVPIT